MKFVFQVYDSAAEAYMTPIYRDAKGLAIREFADAALDPQTMISKHPEHFTLFYVGTWDPFTGDFTPEEAKVALGTALEFVARGPEEVSNG